MECFSIYSNGLDGRIDPDAYHPKRMNAIHKVKSSHFPLFPLKEVVDFKKQIVTDTNDDFIYLGLKNIESNNGIFLPSNEEKETIGSAFQFKKGDILFPKLRPYLNKVHLAKFDGICSTEFHVLRTKNCDQIYLFAFLNSNLVVNQTSHLMTGNTLPRLQTNDVKNLLIPIPEPEIQVKIRIIIQNAYALKKIKENEAKTLLDSIDDFVLDKLVIKLPEINDNMCYSVSSGALQNNRIDPYYYQPKFETLDVCLAHGKYSLHKLEDYITNIHYGASLKNTYVNEGIPFLRILNLKPNKIELGNVVKLPTTMKIEINKAFVSEGDLLISRSGSVGIVSVVPKEADGYAFGSFMIKFCLNNKISKRYVSLWLNNKLSHLFIQREKIGAIQGNITIPTIKSIKIPIPPLDVQIKIADEVKSSLDKARLLQQEAQEILEKAKSEVEKILMGN